MADSTPVHPARPQRLPLVSFPDRERPGSPLPVAQTSFVGREQEAAAVAGLLRRADVRLITLTGPGGVGKTRLALRVAAALADAFADGARFVDLSTVTDPELVLPSIAELLGLREAGGESIEGHLRAWLAAREVLLVLDNLEQVVDAAPALAALLAACPALTILATSRVVLRLTAEHVVPVEPLPLETDAVALFAQRARAADPSFALTEANAPTVAAIVRRVEGLPLAIELAAARIRHLSPAALLAQLTERLRVLTGGPRDVPARQRTLRDTIAWSHGLLSPAEQALFRRLAVFAGGCTPASAAAVADPGGELGIDVLDGLFALVDHSLLRRTEPVGTGGAEGDEPRFRMLESVREFALAQLDAAGEVEAIRARHAAYVADLAERTVEILRPISVGGLARLAVEHDNARAALAWAIERGVAETGLRIATAYNCVWESHGYLGEGRRWLRQVLAIDAGSPALRGAAFFDAGWLAILQGDLAAAEAACREAQTLAQTTAPDPMLCVAVVTGLGVVALERGDPTEAEARFREALELARIADDDWNLGGSLLNLGVVAEERGDRAGAAALYEQAMPLTRRSGDPWALAVLLGNVSGIARRQGDRRRAAALDRERLAINRDLRNRGCLADCCLYAAEVAVWLGRPERAARLLGAATADLEEIGLHLRAEWQRGIDNATEAARAALGDEAFAAAWATGRRLPLEEAVVEADATFIEEEAAAEAEAAAPLATPSPGAEDHGLSSRELEVVRLIAAGRSNQAIADALFISHRTATTHVRNVLNKLGLDSRTAVAAWAIRRGLA